MRLTAILIFVLLTGCAQPDASADRFTVVDSAGVQIASNGTAASWPKDSVWHLREAFRIESRDDDPHYQWDWIVAAAVNSRQELHLLDVSAQRVQVYSAGGEWLRTTGGPGAGPGELGRSNSTVATALVTRADSVVVVDMGNLRVNIYSPEGVPVRSHGVPLSSGNPYRFGLLGGETLLEQTQPILLSDSAAAPVSVLLAIDATGVIADTLLTIPDMPPLDLRAGVAGMPTLILGPELSWDAGPDGRIAIGFGARYEIRVYGSGGTLERIIRRDVPARAVTAAERERLVAPIQQGFDVQLAQADSTMAAVLRQMRENVIVADVFPYFERILFGPEGRLLVSQARPVVGPDDVGPPPNARWDLFDHEGRYLGVLELPLGLRVLTATADAIYAIANTPTGGHAVVKLVP